MLLLADQDKSLLSGLVAGAYSQGELGKIITVEKVTLAAGTARINAGEASGLLLIPEGFSNAFLNAEQVTLTLRTNPSQIILPGIITEVTEILLDAGFYAERLLRDELNLIRGAVDGDGADEILVAAISVAIQQKIEAVVPYLYPPGHRNRSG